MAERAPVEVLPDRGIAACAQVLTTSDGAILHAGGRHGEPHDGWFEGEHWRRVGAQVREIPGRGAVLVVEHPGGTWAIRHYQRGGLVAKLIEHHYLWTGLERTRAFREWRLLARLSDAGLPVPEPIAARVRRTGPIYTADLITSFLADTRKLSAYIADDEVPEGAWERIGRMVRAFHDRGVRHPDLTAHNILLDSRGEPALLDFDNAALEPPGRWREAGLARLERSLRKVAMETGTQFDAAGWQALVAAYRGAGAPSA